MIDSAREKVFIGGLGLNREKLLSLGKSCWIYNSPVAIGKYIDKRLGSGKNRDLASVLCHILHGPKTDVAAASPGVSREIAQFGVIRGDDITKRYSITLAKSFIAEKPKGLILNNGPADSGTELVALKLGRTVAG